MIRPTRCREIVRFPLQNNVGTAVAYCESSLDDVCRSQPCFYLCCPEWHIADSDGSCKETNETLVPPGVYEDPYGKGESVSSVDGDVRYFHAPLEGSNSE